VQELKQEEFKELFSEAQLKRKTERRRQWKRTSTPSSRSYVRVMPTGLPCTGVVFVDHRGAAQEVRDEMTDRFGNSPWRSKTSLAWFGSARRSRDRFCEGDHF